MKRVKDLCNSFGNLLNNDFNEVEIRVYSKHGGDQRYNIKSNTPMIARLVGLLVHQPDESSARTSFVSADKSSAKAKLNMVVAPNLPMPTMKNLIRRARFIEETVERNYKNCIVMLSIDNITIGTGKNAMDEIIKNHPSMLSLVPYKVTAYITIKPMEKIEVHISIISENSKNIIINSNKS